MKNNTTLAIIATGFFGLIALAVYLTGSAYCLWALVLLHGMEIETNK